MTTNPFQKAADDNRARGDRAYARNLEATGRVVLKLLQTIVDGGYAVRVHNGEDFAGPRTRVAKEAFKTCFQTDEDRIYITPYGSEAHAGWVYLVYGNDASEVIADYGAQNLEALEALLKPATEYADTQ